jgi:catechol 2,3-dioxygenase-like lactoylglutathione lyase family enzyme
MKRLHLHVAVSDIDPSVGFYSTLFGAPPSVLKRDYAKWMLEDPRVNFAISARGGAAGVDHIGIQTDSQAELRELAARLHGAGTATQDEEATTCCYARSDKAWVNDPSGLRWETFFTFGESTVYGEDAPQIEEIGGACCTAETPQGVCCPPKPELAADAPCCAPTAA